MSVCPVAIQIRTPAGTGITRQLAAAGAHQPGNAGIDSLALGRNHLQLPQGSEKNSEHILGIDAVMEAGAARLDGA
jgi:hypothetical protein